MSDNGEVVKACGKDETTITISVSTREALKGLGRKAETYDDIIKLLILKRPKKFRPSGTE